MYIPQYFNIIGLKIVTCKKSTKHIRILVCVYISYLLKFLDIFEKIWWYINQTNRQTNLETLYVLYWAFLSQHIISGFLKLNYYWKDFILRQHSLWVLHECKSNTFVKFMITCGLENLTGMSWDVDVNLVELVGFGSSRVEAKKHTRTRYY